jgi:hypothetical protein
MPIGCLKESVSYSSIFKIILIDLFLFFHGGDRYTVMAAAILERLLRHSSAGEGLTFLRAHLGELSSAVLRQPGRDIIGEWQMCNSFLWQASLSSTLAIAYGRNNRNFPAVL